MSPLHTYVGVFETFLIAVCVCVCVCVRAPPGRYLVPGDHSDGAGEGGAPPLGHAPHESSVPHPQEQPPFSRQRVLQELQGFHRRLPQQRPRLRKYRTPSLSCSLSLSLCLSLIPSLPPSLPPLVSSSETHSQGASETQVHREERQEDGLPY